MRQLRIDVEVTGTEQAVRELGRVDRAVDGVTATSATATKNVGGVTAALGSASKAADTATQATGRMAGALAVAKGAMSALVTVELAQMLATTAKSAFSMADSLDDLGKQTHVGASALMKMVNAAELSGVSATSLTTIMTKLTDAVAGGDKSVASAVARLGLDLSALRQMSPDQMFTTIVQKLAAVGDANLQTKLAFDVFGRHAKDALKLVNDGFADNVRQAASWSDSTNATLARGGENFTKFQQAAVAALGNVLGAMVAFDAKVQATKSALGAMLMAGATQGLNTSFAVLGAMRGTTTFDTPAPPARARTGDIALDSLTVGLPSDEELKRITDELNKQATAVKNTSGAVERLLNQRGWDAHVAALHAEARALGDVAVMSAAAAQGLASVAASRKLDGTWENVITGRGDVTPRTLTSAFDLSNSISLGGFVPVGGQPSTRGKGNALNSINWGSLFQQGAGIVMSGGDVGGGLGSLVGGAGGQWLGTMIKTAATAVGSAGGAMLGSVVPVVGTIVGGMLGKWVGGLFGPSKNAQMTQQANAGIAQTQGGLLEQFGSIGNIASTNTAGAELAAAWGSRGVAGQAEFNRLVAEFKAMTEQQNALLSEQETTQATILELEKQRAALAESLVPTWQTVSGLLEKYGISLDGAGQTVKQMATTASFKTMIDDIQTLERAGVDVGGMLLGMTDEINKMVGESVRMGTEIPLNMKPYIEELARAGKLTTDLKDIKWGAAVKSEADVIKESMSKLDETISKLGDRLKEIADMLAKMIPNAAKEGAAGVEDAYSRARPKITVDVEYNDPGRGEPSSSGYGPEGFAGGTGGLRDFGRGRLAVLHGREAVVTERQWHTMQAQASAAPAPVSVQVDARGSWFETDASMQRMADKVAQALMLRAGANTAFVGQA